MARRSYTSKSKQAEPFELDGVEFTPGRVNMLRLMDLAGVVAKLGEGDKLTEEEQVKAADQVSEFFRDVLGADYARFRQHTIEHGTDDETIMAIITDIIGDVVGPPSDRPSPSPPGPTSTGTGPSDDLPAIERVNLATGQSRWVTPTDEEWEQLMAQAREQPPGS